METDIKARIHSLETFGALDGPGIRFIVFFQGCPLHCLYCHNPDSLCMTDGKDMTLDELFTTIYKYRHFTKGGVTLSGGEPLAQADFCLELIKLCKKNEIHTAIDTSGVIPLSKSAGAINEADLILLDIKAIDPELCKKVTGSDNKNALLTLDYTKSINKPVWIRHVMVPGLTLVEKELTALADYLVPYKNVQKIELLPFHKMGEYKWEEMNMTYKLSDTPAPTPEEIAMAHKIFSDRGLPL